MTTQRPPAGGAVGGEASEVPLPVHGVLDLKAERLDLATRLTGPLATGAIQDGGLRRAALVELVAARLGALW